MFFVWFTHKFLIGFLRFSISFLILFRIHLGCIQFPILDCLLQQCVFLFWASLRCVYVFFSSLLVSYLNFLNLDEVCSLKFCVLELIQRILTGECFCMSVWWMCVRKGLSFLAFHIVCVFMMRLNVAQVGTYLGRAVVSGEPQRKGDRLKGGLSVAGLSRIKKTGMEKEERHGVCVGYGFMQPAVVMGCLVGSRVGVLWLASKQRR